MYNVRLPKIRQVLAVYLAIATYDEAYERIAPKPYDV